MLERTSHVLATLSSGVGLAIATAAEGDATGARALLAARSRPSPCGRRDTVGNGAGPRTRTGSRLDAG